MSKKNNKRKQNKRVTKTINPATPPKKRSKFSLIAFFAGGFLVIIATSFLYPGENPTPRASEISVLKAGNTSLRENRPTLSPQRFSGTFRLAYEAARKIPEVLDRLYCYCHCQENLGHKNLLSCYVDTHAST